MTIYLSINLILLPDEKQHVSQPGRWHAGKPVDMLSTCKYARHMSKMIQLRNVPDALHRTLKARAALDGLSLSDYILREIERLAERPTLDEIKGRLRHRKAVLPKVSPAAAVREERERP